MKNDLKKDSGNRDTLRAAMDRRLSFLDERPSCRPALMQRIAEEEAPVMKKKLSVGLVFALVLVSLSVIALAAGLLLSPRVSAAQLADRALEKAYGVTNEMQDFFAREEEELADGTFRVTYTGAGSLEYALGTYTALVKDGKAEITWSHDGEKTDGGYDSEAWGAEQLKQMLSDSMDKHLKQDYFDKAIALMQKYNPAGLDESSSEASESFEEYYEKREASKNGALNARKLSEEEMFAIAREFLLSNWSLTEKEIERLELYTVYYETGDNTWYETVNGKPCFLVEYLLDEEDWTAEKELDETAERNNRYFKIYVNVETGMIEQYESSSGLGGWG